MTSGNVVDNGDFSQVNPDGTPVGWGIFTQGGSGYWNVSGGVFNFYRTDGMSQAVTLQYTGLTLGPGAPLDLTFKMGNSDTVRKRLTVMIHTPTFDDLALCTFWLDPNQPLVDPLNPDKNYAMRMHTTKDWTDATVSFYAAQVNAPGSTGAYQLDDVSLTHRPALNAAKTECVDRLAPSTGGAVTGPMLENGDFANGTTAWTLEGGLASQVTNSVLEFHRNGAAPAIKQFTTWAADPDQRLAALFELGNTSTTRQRVTITFKDQTNGDLTNCVFWLAANSPKQLYAMTGYAGIAWANPGLTVEPATSGGSVAWLQFDTVTLFQTTQEILGTECFEPGSFVVENGWPMDPGAPAPAPAPAPEPAPLSDRSVLQFPSSPVPQLHESSGPSAPPLEAVTVMVMGTGTGSVTSSPGGLTCGPYYVACTGWFAEGSSITLTATPDAGQVFVGWTGACAGVDPCALSVVGPQAVGALFGAPLTFYHTDVLGSVRMITDANGTVVIRQDYLAFGEQTGALTGDPRRFTGKELDPETALQYFGARYYRSETGRFGSVDPVIGIEEALVDPERWNRYSYVSNRPTQYVDPDGRKQERTEQQQNRLAKAFLDGKISREDYMKAALNTGPSELGIIGTAAAVVATVVMSGGGAVMAAGTTCVLTPSCNQAVQSAIEGLAPGASPSRGAFEVAKAGGKHAGMLTNYAGRSLDELLSGIASYERRIADHLDKLANPAKYASEWGTMTEAQRSGLLGFWRKEIQNLKEQADVLRGLAGR